MSRVCGDEYYCYCPLHDDKSPSLAVNVRSNVAYCFAGCYSGRLVGLISRLENVGLSKAYDILLNESIFDFNSKATFDSTPIGSFKAADNLDWKKEVPYLVNRGFQRGIIKLWGAEYCPEIEHIRIPVTWEDKLVGQIYRTTQNLIPKYLYTRGFPKKRVLFGQDMFRERNGTINIVEGALDCIWLWQCGYPNSLAILGSTMSDEQAAYLKTTGKKIKICLDNDVAGKKGAEKACEKLNSMGVKSWIVDFPPGKDAQETSKEELDEIMRVGGLRNYA